MGVNVNLLGAVERHQRGLNPPLPKNRALTLIRYVISYWLYIITDIVDRVCFLRSLFSVHCFLMIPF